MRILIVDDDYTSRAVLKHILSPYGECELAADGLEAVAVFEEAHEQGRPFDLIALDILMPNLNGLEAAARIRQLETGLGVSPGKEAVVIMTTSVDDMKAVSRSFHDGLVAAYILKPYDPDTIAKSLAQAGLI